LPRSKKSKKRVTSAKRQNFIDSSVAPGSHIPTKKVEEHHSSPRGVIKNKHSHKAHDKKIRHEIENEEDNDNKEEHFYGVYTLGEQSSKTRSGGVKIFDCTNIKTGENCTAMFKRDTKVNQELTEKLLYHFKCLQKLDHPNIVRAYNLFESQSKGATIKNWTAVIEKVEGGILNTIQNMDHMSEAIVGKIVFSIVDAL